MSLFLLVALLAEGVDRNCELLRVVRVGEVALLAEGVDRNDFDTLVEELDATVALLAEGVDRNILEMSGTSTGSCRPPRGGRG